MAGPPLDPAIAREALKAHREHASQQKAAEALGISRSTLQSRLKTAAALGITEDYVPLPTYMAQADDDGPPPSRVFDDRWDIFTKWIGRRSSLKAPKPTLGPVRVIDHYTDLHIPHMNEAAFYNALAMNQGGHRAVLGGDSLNAGAVSRFIESDIVHPRDEFAQLALVLQALAAQYEEVDVNIGNHVDRFRKYFQNRLPPYVMFLCQVNPIQFVVDGLRMEHGITNIRVAKPVIDGLDSSNWMTLVGDCAFTHGESHSRIHMRPVENVAKWMRRWQRHMPMVPRVVVNEHNHRGGMAYDEEAATLLIQAPCFSRNVAYQTGPDLKYGPNQLGFVRIVQNDGCTLVNKSRFYLLDESGEERVA
jgi:DNA-binding Lrp family transcriptional regulator